MCSHLSCLLALKLFCPFGWPNPGPCAGRIQPRSYSLVPARTRWGIWWGLLVEGGLGRILSGGRWDSGWVALNWCLLSQAAPGITRAFQHQQKDSSHFFLQMQTQINKFRLRVKSKVMLARRLQESRDCASAVIFPLPLGSGCVGDWAEINRLTYKQSILKQTSRN